MPGLIVVAALAIGLVIVLGWLAAAWAFKVWEIDESEDSFDK